MFSAFWRILTAQVFWWQAWGSIPEFPTFQIRDLRFTDFPFSFRLSFLLSRITPASQFLLICVRPFRASCFVAFWTFRLLTAFSLMDPLHSAFNELLLHNFWLALLVSLRLILLADEVVFLQISWSFCFLPHISTKPAFQNSRDFSAPKDLKNLNTLNYFCLFRFLLSNAVWRYIRSTFLTKKKCLLLRTCFAPVFPHTSRRLYTFWWASFYWFLLIFNTSS